MATTIVALQFQDGHIIGADTKRSHIDGGFVEIRRKLTYFKDTNICYAFAGHSEMGRFLMSEVNITTNDIPPAEMDTLTVAVAIKAEMDKQHKAKDGMFRPDTQLGCIVVGHDHMFQIDFDQAGTRFSGDALDISIAAIGSGQSIAGDYLKAIFGDGIEKNNPITEHDARDGIIRSLREAIVADEKNSKGPVDIVILRSSGERDIQRLDVAGDDNVLINEDEVKDAEALQKKKLKEYQLNAIMAFKEKAREKIKQAKEEKAKQARN